MVHLENRFGFLYQPRMKFHLKILTDHQDLKDLEGVMVYCGIANKDFRPTINVINFLLGTLYSIYYDLVFQGS